MDPAMRRSSRSLELFPEPAGATLGPIGPKSSAPVRNWPMHLPNCAAVSVQRAEQLVSLAKGSSPLPWISQLFHRANSPEVYCTFYPQPAHRRLKESSWETRRIVPKTHRICAESDLGPDFIGTLVP